MVRSLLFTRPGRAVREILDAPACVCLRLPYEKTSKTASLATAPLRNMLRLSEPGVAVVQGCPVLRPGRSRDRHGRMLYGCIRFSARRGATGASAGVRCRVRCQIPEIPGAN